MCLSPALPQHPGASLKGGTGPDGMWGELTPGSRLRLFPLQRLHKLP